MKKLKHGIDLALLASGAILTGLTLVFPVIGFLQWVSMIPLIFGALRICSDESVRLRGAYGYGFFTVFVYYMVLYHWFVDLYPLDFVGLSNGASVGVVALAWIGLSILQALVGGLIFLILRCLYKLEIFTRVPILAPFAFAALWILFEWSSTLTWTGVPWGRLCLGQIDYLPMLQSAALFGSYFVSFLILAVNGLLAYAILCRPRQLLCASIALALFATNLVYGLIAREIPASGERTVRVAVVQGNFNSHEKWSRGILQKTQTTCAELTRRAAAEGAELVVWPETVFPYELNERWDLQAYLSDLAVECNVTLMVGAFYQTEDAEYNALYMIDPDGTLREEYYAKRHLVPFGEYVPMQSFIETVIPPLASLSKLGGSLTAGEDSAIFSTKMGKIGSLICFDSIYEQLTIDSVRDGAELIVVSTNDSWFNDSAAVYQHQAQSQLRAIESGRCLVRSANTGISTVIASDGELLAWIDPLERGYAVADVTVSDSKTLYGVIGNTFVYFNIAFVLGTLGCGIFFWQKKKRAEQMCEK